MTTPTKGQVVFHKVNNQRMVVVDLRHPTRVSGNGGHAGGYSIAHSVIVQEDTTKPATGAFCRYLDAAGNFTEREFMLFELSDLPTN